MLLGDPLKSIRESKNLSQGDIEHRTGLLRCYVSRVENGHTIPSIDTLEKWTKALEIPMYQLFYDGEKPEIVKVAKETKATIKESRLAESLRHLIVRMKDRDQQLIMYMARKLARTGV